MTEQEAYRLRQRMVDEQIVPRGIGDPRVLSAMRRVPRHLFVPEQYRDGAYEDNPVSIGHGQTISQPFIVASMTQEARLSASARVLEIGTGSGYQTAILAELCRAVYSIERLPVLAQLAAERLQVLGYRNCSVRTGDGYGGWLDQSPFDAIVVTAAAAYVAQAFLDQVAVGGRVIIPVVTEHLEYQQLFAIDRTATGYERHLLYEVRFVPLIPDGG